MTKMPPEAATLEIAKARYPEARAVFLCGSVVRKEDTPFSDLDLVVVYEHVEQARRESYVHQTWPVEAFIHDPQTLEFFFREVDRPTGIPSLADMVAGGMALPEETTRSSLALEAFFE
jgi:predicted nucleotidyltransferase